MENFYYKLKDGRYWDVALARFSSFDEVPVTAKVYNLDSGEDYLYTTLKFYDYPLGELATDEDKLDALIEENKNYLIRILVLYSMDIRLPQDVLTKFEQIKSKASKIAPTAIAKFLESKNGHNHSR